MRSTLALALSLALAGFASSQTPVQYIINPDSVPLDTRKSWCQSQVTQCPLICLQYPENSAVTLANRCDPKVLTYSCICKNGQEPNATEYSQTLPFHICQEWQNQCVKSCGQNNDCSYDCRANHPCGAQNPTRVNTSTITTMPATQSSGSESTTAPNYAPLGAAETTPAAGGSFNKPNSASTISSFGQIYGAAIVAMGFFAGFALVL